MNKTLKFGDFTIELSPTMPRFALMGLAAAQASGSQDQQMAATWRLLRGLVQNWNDLENWMAEDDAHFDELENIIEQAMELYDLPDEEDPEKDRPGPTEESFDSSPSSTVIPTTSRVVSLSRGTVEVKAEDTEPEIQV